MPVHAQQVYQLWENTMGAAFKELEQRIDEVLVHEGDNLHLPDPKARFIKYVLPAGTPVSVVQCLIHRYEHYGWRVNIQFGDRENPETALVFRMKS